MIIFNKENCDNGPCERLGDCRLDRGSPFCYEASPISRVMLDPYWIGGQEKHAKRTKLRWAFLLKNDPISPLVVTPTANEAARFCEDGLSQSGAMRSVPFFNQHILADKSDRIESRRLFYQNLFEKVKPYFINVGAGTKEEISNQIRNIIGIGR